MGNLRKWLQKKLVSFVLPAHDERASLPPLFTEIRSVVTMLDLRHEIVVVDDGSQDGTRAWLQDRAERDAALRVLGFPQCRGQSAALSAGLDASRGEVVVTMDADLQNDPRDTPHLLAALQTCDLVCGVRARRRDRWSKRIASKVGNRARRAFLGDEFRDAGCALRAWRRPVVEDLPRFDGFHRFVPVLARAGGFRVSEVAVAHRARRHGRTHYGNFDRAWRGLADLCGVAWLRKRRLDGRAETINR